MDRKYLLFLIILVLVSMEIVQGTNSKSKKTIYLFGDSVFDVGTNNYLHESLAKANRPYYGIDYENSTPTGRFSNGFNLADSLAILYGYDESPPPYLHLVNKKCRKLTDELQKGVNFASAGSGVFNDTGHHDWKKVVPLKEQIEQFALVTRNITAAKGPEEAAKFLGEALYLFSLGSNDIFETLNPNNPLIPRQQFMLKIRSEFHYHLQRIYNMGGRRFGIVGVGPLGCCPHARALNKTAGGNGSCNQELNQYAEEFQETVGGLLTNMSSALPEMKYALGDIIGMSREVFKNSTAYGFTSVEKACCGKGEFNGESFCFKNTSDVNLCENRREHLFWDMVHLSEAASQLSAFGLFSGLSGHTTPITFGELAN